MRAPDPDNPLELTEDALVEIDQICLQFEHAWQTGDRPPLGAYLSRLQGPAREGLFGELVSLDVDYRQRRGDHIQPSDYLELHTPTHPAIVETVQASLAATPVVIQNARQGDAPLPPALGRYRVIERVGSGGFGTVYRAHDDVLQRDVAVKVPHAHLVHQRPMAELFRREARALASLRHPAIVPVYDVSFDAHRPADCFIVSEYMPGGDLRRAVRHQRLPIPIAVEAVVRVADALHHAHQHGIVHRDVKLSNLLRDGEGQVFIADFGLALQDEDDGGGLVGTPANMSPEQRRGDGSVDARSDVYALGIVLYELLCDRHPFPDAAVERDPPVSPRSLNPQVPKRIERVCLQALAENPENRPPSAAALAEQLRSPQPLAAAHWRILALVLAIVCGATGFLAFWPTGATRAIPVAAALPSPVASQTLAILPFQTSGDAPEHAGMGMTDILITKLAHLRHLVVRTPESVQHYDADTDPIQAGRELQVDHVLTGTLKLVEGAPEAFAQLVRVTDGEVIWSASFTAPTDLFSLQDHIARAAIPALALQVSQEERQRVEARGTANPQAYEAYIRGRHHWHHRASKTGDRVNKAIEEFKRAIDHDPMFALAYVGLAESYATLNLYTGEVNEQAYPRARAAARKALELDPQQTSAHAVLALITFYYDWDHVAAEGGFRKAIALNPNNAHARQWYAELLYFGERFDEALEQLKAAARLDPLSPVIADLQGTPYLWCGDVARARREFEKALEHHPDSVNALFSLGLCALQQGNLEEALAYHQQQHSQVAEAYVLARMGRTAEAKSKLEASIGRSPHPRSPYNIAIVYVGLGETDTAFEWFERALETHDEHMTWLLVDPRLDPIRDDPRFLQLLRVTGRVE